MENFEYKHCKHICIPRLLVSEPLIVSTIPLNIGQHHNKHQEVLYSLILSFSYKVSTFSPFFDPLLLSFFLQARKAHTHDFRLSINQAFTYFSGSLPLTLLTSHLTHLFSLILSSQWHQPSAHSLVSSSKPSPTKGSKID